MNLRRINFLFLLLFFALPSYALSPEIRLMDEKQEKRAMNIFLEVRCLVCNGQVIENSDTEFSFQMRALIRKEISTGKSDEEIKNQLKEKFGADILASPKASIAELILIFITPMIITGFFLWKRRMAL